MNVLLIDDHPVVRKGLIELLSQLDRDFECKEAANVVAAEAYADDFDLVFLDMHLDKGPIGTDALAVARTHFPSATIIVVSGDEDPRLVRRCIELGASGFIPKKFEPEVCRSVISLILSGGVYLPPLVLEAQREARPASAAAAAVAQGRDKLGLSERQLEVLSMVIRGKSNKMVARELDVSEGTVKQHLSSAFRALGVSNRTEAVYKAAELGLQFPAATVPGA
jgi:DNA-binding NarL/FixJ family response regulator